MKEILQGKIPLPERIRQARLIKGITQLEFAEMLGVSKQAVSQYELGSNNPKPKTFEEICSILEMSHEFFFKTMPADITENPVFFRKNKTSAKKNFLAFEGIIQWVEEIYYYLQKYINFPPVKILTKEKELYSFEEILQIAKEVRYSWGLGLGPISNVTILLENNGFVISKIPTGIKTVDACSKLYAKGSNTRPIIFLSQDKSAVRSRRDVIHELAHHVLHSWVDKSYIQDKEHHQRMEQEAEWFASAFLTPYEAMEREAVFLDIDRLIALKKRWGVSIQSLLFYLNDLNLISESKFNKLKRSIYSRGWKTHEPLDNEISHEEPYLLKTAVELLLDNKSTDDLLEELPFPRTFIEKLCNLPYGYLLPKNIVKMPKLTVIKN